MMTSRWTQECYGKSQKLTARQDSSNPVIETHPYDTHEFGRIYATGFLAGYAAMRIYRRPATTRLLDGSALSPFFRSA
jgi:hypothetical protein